MRTVFALIFLVMQALPLLAQSTLTFQQGVDGYNGAISVRFEYNVRQQTVEDTTHRYRYIDNNRIYNLEYFDLGDMSSWAEIAQARLIFYRQGGSVYTGSKIFVRRINDPDGIGMWKVAGSNGFRNGANKESRDDTTNPDTKWQNSDPDSPEDLNADYFQYVLEDTLNSPYFIPQTSDTIGQPYELDVTADVEAFRTGALSNQGWATWHADDAANINNWIANSHISKSALRPKLVITFKGSVSAPTNLTATAQSETQINLSWTDNSDNESGFIIERSINFEAGFDTIAVVGDSVTSYDDMGLTESTEYFYRLSAFNINDTSVVSDTASAITVAVLNDGKYFVEDTTRLNGHGLVVFEAEHYDGKVNRGGHSYIFETEIGGYSAEGYMAILPDLWYNISNDWVNQSSRLDFNIKIIKTGRYYLWVRTQSQGDWGKESWHAGYDGKEITTAAKLLSDATSWTWLDQSNYANWGDRAYMDIDSAGAHVFNLYMRKDGALIDKILLTTDPAYDPKDAEPAESMRDYIIPRVTDLTASAVSYTSINLRWTDNSNNETGFFIERSINPGIGFDSLTTVGADVTSFEDTGLTESTTYTYRVTVFNDTDTSAASEAASAATEAVASDGKYYMQDTTAGNNGLIVFEAEHYDDKVNKSGMSFLFTKEPAGYSGEGLMVVLPDTGFKAFGKGKWPADWLEVSPHLDYNIGVLQAGTYYVWIYTNTQGSWTNDSWHVGIDGMRDTTAANLDTHGSDWGWYNTSKWMGGGENATRAYVEIAEAGKHVLNIWVREDGAPIDKIVLTNDPTYVPSGLGPDESIRGDIIDNIESITNTLPKRYELYQNYPNPFNPQTTIKYDLVKSGMVELNIYNVLGQKVLSLVNKNQSAGSHSITFNVSNLPSGLYYYILKVEKFSKIKKMILLK